MILPTGNPLFEHVALSGDDVNILMENLANNRFSGYLAVESNRKIKGGFFYSLGIIKSAFEVSDNAKYKLIKNPNLLNRIVATKSEISVYILSPKLVDVLSFIYLYNPQDSSHNVKKKDFKKFLSSVEANSLTGFASLSAAGGIKEIVFTHGRPVIDSFTGEYGSILCQNEVIDAFIDGLPKDGAKVTLYGEKSFELEEKDMIARRTLEYEKELKVKTMRGIMTSNDVVKIDEMFFKEWGVKPSVTIQVEIVTPKGPSIVKCSSAKNLSGNISISANLMKKMALTENAVVNIKPVMQ